MARSTFDLFGIVKRIVDAKAQFRSPELPQQAERPPLPARRVRSGFKFDRPLMQWIKNGAPKTMGVVANEYRGLVTRGDGREHVAGAVRRRDYRPR
jgi:hypothetical protein